MTQQVIETLKDRLREKDYRKLADIDNPELHEFVARFVKLCNPGEVIVCTDSPEDIRFIREEAIRAGEEKRLAIEGHTVHFDGYYDQARDKGNTKFLLPKGASLGPHIEATDKDEGLREIRTILQDIMRGRRLYVRFFCLGPLDSEFSMPAVQLTDSAYVAHSEDLLYRQGYEEFKRQGRSVKFLRFVHSQGELQNGVSKNIDRRRIYIDLEDETVYSVNTQYGGNTIGLKKLSLRLAIRRASEKSWLAEHMFILGVHGPGGRVTYLTGAFPSLCGKTSTSMLEKETIVGDDIAFLRVKDGKIHAANIEKGIFGIIQEVNTQDDPILWKALHAPGEIIFSNVLVSEQGTVSWIGKNGEPVTKGFNHSGEWVVGKRDEKGNPIPPSHPNARFTLALRFLENVDPQLDNPEGVVVGGIVYGGRDSDTSVPVEESFDWIHGVVTKGASLESETTAATLGKTGIRKFNPMSNLDFLPIPVDKYIENHLKFGAAVASPPSIFSVNYFLKDSEDNFLTDKSDKMVWYKWMELRCHKDLPAIETPTGLIPRYQDLKRLFKEVFGRDYSQDLYIRQFTLRIPEKLAGIERIVEIHRTEIPNTAQILFQVLEEQRRRLIEARNRHGDYISPTVF